jgi:hypothetical protein
MEYSLKVGLVFMVLVIVMFLSVFHGRGSKDEELGLQLLLKLLLVLTSMACSTFLLFPAIISSEVGEVARNFAAAMVKIRDFGPLSFGGFCCSMIIGLCTPVMFSGGI